jgi:hypothetical protein
VADLNRSAKDVKPIYMRFIAVVIGFLAMFPIGTVFDQQNWPVFHSWGLAHGAFTIAWPLFSYVAYRVLSFLVSDREERE